MHKSFTVGNDKALAAYYFFFTKILDILLWM